MCYSIVITLYFCVISSSFNLISSDEMIIGDINLKNLSNKSFGAQISFKNEQVDFNEKTTECFRHNLANCDTRYMKTNCLDNFNKVLQYSDSGCIDLVLSCNCATYDANRTSLEIGRCFYNCRNMENSMLDDTKSYTILPYQVLEWNDIFCGPFNRTGTLCGKCQKGLCTRAYSYDLSCFECMNILSNWIKYILYAFLPLSCFCFIIFCFNLVSPSSLLQVFALYCQIFSAPLYLRIALLYSSNYSFSYKVLQLIAALYGVWNLDFIRSYSLGICLQTDTLTTLSLDLAVALYPLVLILIIYFLIQLHDADFKPLVIMWRPFKVVFKYFNKEWDIKTSTVDSFAAFMLLSSVKLLNVCFDILIPVEVTTIFSEGNTPTKSWRVFYDASIPYFGSQHLPYAIIAIVILITNILIPTFLLLLYPYSIFQFFLNKFPHRWQLIMRTFVDSFQGCYKDGIQSNSFDCRFVSAMPFIIRLSFFILYALTLDITFNVLAGIGCVILSMFYLYLDPYKNEQFSTNNINIILLLGSFCICCVGLSSTYNSNGDMKSYFNCWLPSVGLFHYYCSCCVLLLEYI